MNTAIAAAMRDFAGRKSFNFRQGEFAAKNVRFNLKEQLKWAAVVAGIIFFLAIVNQILDYGLKTQAPEQHQKTNLPDFQEKFSRSEEHG